MAAFLRGYVSEEGFEEEAVTCSGACRTAKSRGKAMKQAIEGLPAPPDGYEWGEITALQVDCRTETAPENWYYVGRLQLRRRSQVVFSNGTTTATLTLPEDATAKSRRGRG